MNDSVSAGYSHNPLEKKLGYKPGQNVLLINIPDDYEELTGNILAECTVFKTFDNLEPQSMDLIHIFALDLDFLMINIQSAMFFMKPNASLWCSWLKGSSALRKSLNSTINENQIRDAVLPTGLVDIKVCAVDMNWSGLKLVFRKK